MLTIHSGINRNVNNNPAFGKALSVREQELAQEMDMLTQEYNEERDTWVQQKRGYEDIIHDTEAHLPKPVKTVMKGGAVFAAGVLGGMATGYSAKYIMNSFQKAANSKPAKSLASKFSEYISKPAKKGFDIAKTFVEKQITKIKTSKMFTKNKVKAEKQLDKFANSGFMKSVKKFGNKIANNKVVKSVTGFVDKIFSKFADGVVAVYNKLAKVNYKNAAADTLGVAGGVSTAAVTLMEDNGSNISNSSREDDTEI